MYQNRVSIIGFVGNDAQLRSTDKGRIISINRGTGASRPGET